MNSNDSDSGFIKIRIEHLNENMLDSIKELRVLDKLIIVFSAVIWSFIIVNFDNSDNTIKQVNIVIYFIPFIVSMLLSVKASKLLDRYRHQKKYYFKYLDLKEDELSSQKWKGVNNLFYIVTILNLIFAITLILIKGLK